MLYYTSSDSHRGYDLERSHGLSMMEIVQDVAPAHCGDAKSLTMFKGNTRALICAATCLNSSFQNADELVVQSGK